jgi:hypothetical protein
LEILALPPYVSILKGVALKKLPKIQICNFLLETCTKRAKFFRWLERVGPTEQMGSARADPWFKKFLPAG